MLWDGFVDLEKYLFEVNADFVENDPDELTETPSSEVNQGQLMVRLFVHGQKIK